MRLPKSPALIKIPTVASVNIHLWDIFQCHRHYQHHHRHRTEKGTNGQLDFFALSLCATEDKIHVFRYELEMGNQQ